MLYHNSWSARTFFYYYFILSSDIFIKNIKYNKASVRIVYGKAKLVARLSWLGLPLRETE